MKKTIISAFVLMSLAAFTTVASAGVNLGFSVHQAAALADGFEARKTNNVHTYADESVDVTIGSVFVEWDNDAGTVIGIDVIPGSADYDSQTKSGKTDLDTADGRTSSTAVTQQAGASLENMVTLYVETQVMDSPVYVRAGLSQVSVTTTESLGTGETYGDSDINGGSVGLGVKLPLGDFMQVKLGANYTKFETLKLTGANGNKIEADTEVVTGSLSLALSF